MNLKDQDGRLSWKSSKVLSKISKIIFNITLFREDVALIIKNNRSFAFAIVDTSKIVKITSVQIPIFDP